MRQSQISTMISVIILFLGLVVMPLYFIGIIQWRTDMDLAIQASRDFVDKVIDSGQITVDMESDLNLALSACSGLFSYEVTREVPVKDASFAGASDPGTAATKWQAVQMTSDTVFNPGDIITISVKQETANIFQRLAGAFLGSSYFGKDIIFSGMVR